MLLTPAPIAGNASIEKGSHKKKAPTKNVSGSGKTSTDKGPRKQKARAKNIQNDTSDMNSRGKSKKRGLGGSEDEGDAEDHAEPVTLTAKPKRRHSIKAPRAPTTILKQYQTSAYTPYDPVQNNVGPAVMDKFKSFAQYEKFTLFMNLTVTTKNFATIVPTSGIRLDDRTAGVALRCLSMKDLHAQYPAEFDTAGMIRASRVPLGHCYKKWFEAGKVDIDGNVLTESAYYYLWWRGLHCMMGKEGMDAGLYMIRPSFESFKCEGFGIKVSHKAVVQHASGSVHDQTFTGSKEPVHHH